MYESQNSNGFFNNRLTSIWLGIVVALLLFQTCRESQVISKQEADLERSYLKLKQKDDSINKLIEDVRYKQVEIELVIEMYLDSIENLKTQRSIKNDEKKSISNIVSERRTLDSLAEHVVF